MRQLFPILAELKRDGPASNTPPGFRTIWPFEKRPSILHNVWLLEGCDVLALTATTATIRRPSGSTTIYRKKNMPAPSALGDSLDDPE